MTTRRAFMQIAVAAAAPVALPSVPGMLSGWTPRLALFDESQAPARNFATHIATHQLTTLALRDGDITQAWLRTLRPAWKRGRGAIAGLTTPAALFCLEQLAFTHGRRVVFHAEHVLLPDGRVEHQFQRASQRFDASEWQRAGTRWPQRLADALVDFRAPPGRRPGPSLAGLEPALPEGATLLTSWIIA